MIDMSDFRKHASSSSDAWDSLRLFLAIPFFIALCYTVVGILLVAILLFGFVMAVINNQITYIKTTSKSVQILLGIGILVAVGVSIYGYGIELSDDDGMLGLGIAAGAVVAMILLRFLWELPLERQFSKLRILFRRLFDLCLLFWRRRKADTTIPIMSREKMAAYSVADELSKWGKLRDEGLITEEQFLETRSRLLNEKPTATVAERSQ
jgi:hypothetical protein